MKLKSTFAPSTYLSTYLPIHALVSHVKLIPGSRACLEGMVF